MVVELPGCCCFKPVCVPSYRLATDLRFCLETVPMTSVLNSCAEIFILEVDQTKWLVVRLIHGTRNAYYKWAKLVRRLDFLRENVRNSRTISNNQLFGHARVLTCQVISYKLTCFFVRLSRQKLGPVLKV